jgi:hypothetical protein
LSLAQIAAQRFPRVAGAADTNNKTRIGVGRAVCPADEVVGLKYCEADIAAAPSDVS